MSADPTMTVGASIVNTAFGTDVMREISEPRKAGTETALSSRGKISSVAHKKLQEGQLSQDQGAIVRSIIGAAAMLEGQALPPGSNEKAAKKIFKEAVKQYGDSPDQKATAKRELLRHANALQKAQLSRVFVQTTEGAVSPHSLQKEQLTKADWAENIKETFVVGKERNLNKIAADIHRYMQTGRIQISDSSGSRVPLANYNQYLQDGGNFRDYMGKEFLPKLMIGVGMAEKKDDGQVALSKEGQAILDGFLTATEGKESNDEVRDDLAKLIDHLGKSDSPQAQRLRFALIAVSQNMTVSPGGKMGLLARKGAEEGKYTSMATTPNNDRTEFNITLSREGTMKAQVTSAYQNADTKQGKPMLHETIVTPVVLFKPGDDPELEVGFNPVVMRVPDEHRDHPEVTGLEKSLKMAGFETEVISDKSVGFK